MKLQQSTEKRILKSICDYGVYLTGRLIDDQPTLPDFNLDSDRGYGYHCWDWSRRNIIWDPLKKDSNSNPDPADPDAKFYFNEPCFVPESFCQGLGHPHPTYNPNFYLELHYIRYGNDGVDNADDRDCGKAEPHGRVTPADIDQAGIPPEGEQ